ncbi:MAG: DUF6285 domain-containing protein [Hyphomicrobiales bacterium]
MQDRPSVDELLEAVANFLHNDVMPNTAGRLSFHARVAGNVVQMLRRELATEEDQLAEEWEGLNGLLGGEPRPATLREWRERTHARNAELAERIRSGAADSGPFRDEVFAHLRRVTHLRLTVSDPRLAEATGGPAG